MTPNYSAQRAAPLCFVLVALGVAHKTSVGRLNFDALCEELIAPAVGDAGLRPLWAARNLTDAPRKPMFEQLVLAEYAVVDVTAAGGSILYALGVRDAVRPHSTLLLSADSKHEAFELALEPVYHYAIDGCGRPVDVARQRAALRGALSQMRRATDRPVFRLLHDVPAPRIERLKTDLFREEAAYPLAMKRSVAEARATGAHAVGEVERNLGRLDDVEAGVLVDLLLSYRATGAWPEMIRLVDEMPEPFARTAFVQQQYGFALNRAGRGGDAERTLRAVIADHGPSSETYALLGRVYKDRWEMAHDGSLPSGDQHLDQAVDAYLAGFQADWRDAFPGVNALTLMEIRDPGGAEQLELAAVVRYANRRRIDTGAADYWDHATRLELAVVIRDRIEARTGAEAALAAVREPWEPQTTAHNLSLMRRARAGRGEVVAWADEIEHLLTDAAENP